jgi:hypothetical protein
MAFVYVLEFASDGPVRQGSPEPGLPVPALISQAPIAIGAGSVQSAAFNSKTRLVCLSVDGQACSVEFGLSPTATSSSLRLPPNSMTFWSVAQLPGQKVAVITNS